VERTSGGGWGPKEAISDTTPPHKWNTSPISGPLGLQPGGPEKFLDPFVSKSEPKLDPPPLGAGTLPIWGVHLRRGGGGGPRQSLLKYCLFLKGKKKSRFKKKKKKKKTMLKKVETPISCTKTVYLDEIKNKKKTISNKKYHAFNYADFKQRQALGPG
jgi:hypothetical protein